MGDRLDLQALLEIVLGSDDVHFQPPESKKLDYPCIIYSRSSSDTKFADDYPYIHRKRYQIKVIDKNPDSLIPDKVENLPLCKFDTHYTKDNLHHNVYNIYF